MIKLLIADDHSIVRQGLKQIISDTSNMTVIDEAANGQEVLDKIESQQIDVLILDLNMPGKSGLEILKQIKKIRPKLPILVLTIYPEDQYAFRVLKAGASGYLTKESAPSELINAIEKVAHGGKYVTPSLAEKLAVYLEVNSDKPLYLTLSDREFQVMRQIASGKTLKEIAEKLCLSVKTISTYRARILEKMKMKTNAEITHYAFQNNLVE